jgi:SAM-dependent methyltransferase
VRDAQPDSLDTDDGEAMQAYYALGQERDRLSEGLGRVEYLRTVEVVSRTLPAPPAIVADIGGGPGRYTDWLLEAGYSVVHRDLVTDHVEQVRARHADRLGDLDAAVGDARSLDLEDDTVDALLLLGPLYHLPREADRIRALQEARRVTRPGGPVNAAAITRWAARLDGILMKRAGVHLPIVLDLIDDVERTGRMPPVVEGGFTGSTHTPGQLRNEAEAAGLPVESLVNLEGVAVFLGDLDRRLEDPDERTLLLDTLRSVESVVELSGTGPHLLLTGRA